MMHQSKKNLIHQKVPEGGSRIPMQILAVRLKEGRRHSSSALSRTSASSSFLSFVIKKHCARPLPPCSLVHHLSRPLLA